MLGTLGVVLPVVFAAGMAARQPWPIVSSVSPEIMAPADRFGPVVIRQTELWPGRDIVTLLRRDPAGVMSVELSPGDLARPDLLVYWVSGSEADVGTLPSQARLLGVLLGKKPLPLPGALRGERGRFLLYSLADHEITAISRALLLPAP